MQEKSGSLKQRYISSLETSKKELKGRDIKIIGQFISLINESTYLSIYSILLVKLMNIQNTKKR